ncbi:membrane protein insertion efficiency factor YidD [Patescibacteria group bacterium]
MLKYIALKSIRLYQRTLSPDHGFIHKMLGERFCKFQPTCSEYTYQAISRYGFLRGGFMGTWRVVRCNPWNPGGDDPIK